jgi:predicted RNase H-like HicB family nuclease
VVSLPEGGDLLHTDGQTYEEALERGKELLEALIATRRSAGPTLPEPRVYAASA